MPSVLIIGATRGLGAALVEHYSTIPDSKWDVYATSRSSSPPESTWASSENVHWLLNIDLTQGPDVASSLSDQLTAKSSSTAQLDTVIITAGYFATESYGSSKWEEQVKMYTLSSIAPVFVIEALDKASLLRKGTKLILVSSESGSITLRHEQEGGGNFGHHGSKAALNMVGRQLSFDLREKQVAVGIVHPSFMRTEMTAGVGFDKFWDDGGALPPDQAAKIMADWVQNVFDMRLSGTYWAPRGTRDIGNWKVVMGGDATKESPVELPW